MDHDEGQTSSAERSLKRKPEPDFQAQTRASKVLAVEDPDKKGSIPSVQLNSTTRTTSFSRPHRDYDVFLSFRGEDTRKNFTDHLNSALQRVGIHTFRDEDELVRGTTISTELLNVIRKSKISIVVFSKGYASSRWCLDELVEIVHCKETMGHSLFPIFYHVDPSDVRKQAGSFAEAFEQHERQFQTERVQRWREALTKVGNCSGWDLQNLANGYESSFIEKIIVEVFGILKPNELKVAKHVVGINSRAEEVVNLLNLEINDVRKVGIYGLGGIGKTTLAKAVYNQVHYGFEGSTCLLNIKENSKQPKGMVHLQKQLLRDILKIKDLKIANVDEGINLIEEKIYGKKVFIILDDMDDPKQLDELLGSLEKFGLGSRVIVTTRDKAMLANLGVHDKYKVKKLGKEESLQLFNLNAFTTGYPQKDFQELSLNAMKYCGGLPLALKILGSSLIGRSVAHWKMELKKLERTPHPKIQEVLHISFDSLEEIEKKIFLDISCFFVGKDKDYVIKVLDDCDVLLDGIINTLIQRSLVTIYGEKMLKMHDLVRDMGRQIVQEESLHHPEKRSRLWFQGDILYVLHNYTGTEIVEGIISNLSVFENEHLETKAFTNMRRLRLLQINGVHLTGSFECLSKELRLLCWHKCPLTFLPHNFHLENLVILDMKHSNIQEVWKNNKKLSKLKVLNLKGCKYLKKSPKFSQVPQLEILILEDCISLVQVHESIGDLGRLVLLNLRGCANLKRLPEDLGNIIALKELFLNDTAIEELPSSIVRLKHLEIFDLSRREEQSSKSLSARHSPWFAHWPIEVTAFGMSLFPSWMSPKRSKPISLMLASISGLHFMKELKLSGRNLSEADFPDTFGSLCSLKKLYLERNNFRILPHCIGRLTNLEMLYLDGCTTLQSISGFPASIWGIVGRGCTSLERVSVTPSWKCPVLWFYNCPKLAEIQGFARLECSSYIFLNRNNNLQLEFGSQVQCPSTLGDDRHRCIRFDCHFKLPNWFSHQSNGGNSISFDVPLISEVENLRLLVCVVYKQSVNICHSDSLIIRNESRSHEHICPLECCIHWDSPEYKHEEDHSVILYLPRLRNNVLKDEDEHEHEHAVVLFQTGDKIEVSIRLSKHSRRLEIKKWGFHVLVDKPNQNEERETTVADGGSDASIGEGHNPPKNEPENSHSL